MGGVRAVPGVRHRDPASGVFDQRDRERERPHSSGGPCSRALPNEQAALKCVYLAIMALDPTGTDHDGTPGFGPPDLVPAFAPEPSEEIGIPEPS